MKNNYNTTGEVLEHIQSLLYKACRGTVLQFFQLKFIPRIFHCNEKLFNWRIRE